MNIERFFRLKELSQRRISQLNREEEIDLLLEKGFEICPKLVFRYIATTRAVNREKSKELYSACITEYLEKMCNSLETVEKQHSQINAKCPRELCKILSDIMKDV